MISRPSSRSGARRRPGPWPKSSQRALQQAFPEGSLRLRGGHRGRPNLPSLPRKPPRQATHDEHARASVQGGKEEDEGGGGLPERDEREHVGHGDSLEEQRGVGAQTLPRDGRSRSSRETQPTTFETLTLESRWAGSIARLLLTRSAEKETFHPRSAGSRDHELEPLRSFQTVSLGTSMSK